MYLFFKLNVRLLNMEIKTVTTQKFVFGASSLAKIDNKSVFIPYSLPGETLTINIVQHKNDYDNAEIVEIITPSKYRVTPPCKYYGLCGGCNMMHIETNYQRQLRKDILCDAFSQFNIDVKDNIEIIFDKDFNYRSRFQFTDGGLSQKKSNNIIHIKNCLCATKPINDYLEKQNDENKEKKSQRLHVFATEKLVGDEKIKVEKPDFSKNVGTVIKGKGKIKKIKENHHFSGTILNEDNEVCVLLKDKKIYFDVRGFFQSNLGVFEKVLSLICNSLPRGKRVLDMYSGCGSISVFLSDCFEHVTLVEHNRDALVFAEKNMSGKNHTSFGLSGASFVKNCSKTVQNFDACVVDPPRSGMEKEVLDYLCTSKIPYIRYLSCDPVTCARDSQKLIKAGYKLEKLYLLDFYPNTSHIECLAIFNLEN